MFKLTPNKPVLFSFYLLVLLASVSQAATTPLSGRYQEFYSSKNMQLQYNQTDGNQYISRMFEPCIYFFDVNGSTKDMNLDTTVDEACMDAQLIQSLNSVYFYEATDDVSAWLGTDFLTGSLSASYGNLSIYSISEVNDGEADSHDLTLMVSDDGLLAITSNVELYRDRLADWEGVTDTIILEGFEFERSMFLQMPADNLTNSDLTGRYAVYERTEKVKCSSPSGVPADNCTNSAVNETYKSFSEIIFDGNGTCTVPKMSETEILKNITSNFAQQITVEKYSIYSVDGTGNATKTDDANGNPVDADWIVTGCSYNVSNTNKLAITINGEDTTTEPNTPETETYNMILSSGARYFKYGTGVITDAEDGKTNVPYYFGMKLNTSPLDNLAGKTYLMHSYGTVNYAYDQANHDNMLDLSSGRLALTFQAAGACSVDMYRFGISLYEKDNDLDFNVTDNERISPACSYVAAGSDPKKIKVTVNLDGNNFTFGARFSDDYRVVKMGFSDYLMTAITPYVYYRASIKALGVLYVGDNASAAVDQWLNTQYWLENADDNFAIIPIISTFLLF